MLPQAEFGGIISAKGGVFQPQCVGIVQSQVGRHGRGTAPGLINDHTPYQGPGLSSPTASSYAARRLRLGTFIL
jgi:hypothetical protein